MTACLFNCVHLKISVDVPRRFFPFITEDEKENAREFCSKETIFKSLAVIADKHPVQSPSRAAVVAPKQSIFKSVELMAQPACPSTSGSNSFTSVSSLLTTEHSLTNSHSSSFVNSYYAGNRIPSNISSFNGLSNPVSLPNAPSVESTSNFSFGKPSIGPFPPRTRHSSDKENIFRPEVVGGPFVTSAMMPEVVNGGRGVKNPAAAGQTKHLGITCQHRLLFWHKFSF